MREMPSISNLAYTSTTNSVDDFLHPKGAGQASGQALLMRAMQAQAYQQPQETFMGTRLVRVFVSDPDDSLPIDSRVLYQGDEKLTDLTDQELFFELPIQELLTKHNGVRGKTRDKDQSNTFGRDVMLEPIKIRDLKMVIVNVANFG